MRSWGKWVSEIRQPKKRSRIWLGSYSTPEAAARAYDTALYFLRGPLVSVNFPENIPKEEPPNLSPRSVQKAAIAAGTALDKSMLLNGNGSCKEISPTHTGTSPSQCVNFPPPGSSAGNSSGNFIANNGSVSSNSITMVATTNSHSHESSSTSEIRCSEAEIPCCDRFSDTEIRCDDGGSDSVEKLKPSSSRISLLDLNKDLPETRLKRTCSSPRSVRQNLNLNQAPEDDYEDEEEHKDHYGSLSSEDNGFCNSSYLDYQPPRFCAAGVGVGIQQTLPSHHQVHGACTLSSDCKVVISGHIVMIQLIMLGFLFL